jgi:hypothetical protein
MGQWEGRRVGRVGEIVAPAITGINRPRRRRWKCLCQCRARPEIIIMESLKLSFPSSGRSFIYCMLSVHTTPRRRSRPPPFLHPAADKAAQVVRICCSAAVAMAVSPSRCLAQAAWSWKACSGSLKEGQGANGKPRAAKGAHPADSPAAVPSCRLLFLLALLPTLSRLSQVTEARR